MKKTLAALAVLGAFAGTAAAADVTLYGIVDLGLNYQYQKVDGQDATNTFKEYSGQNSGSRFGLKGVEDLGNGMKVGFQLENGFTADDGKLGQGNRLFGREARVYAQGAFGELAFGRMGALSSGLGTYNLAKGAAFGTGWGDVTGAKGTLWALGDRDRMDNTVTYVTPSFAGFKAYAQYSFSVDGQETAGNEKQNKRYAGLGLAYNQGALATSLVVDSVLNNSASTNTKDSLGVQLNASYDCGVVKPFFQAMYGKHENKMGATIATLQTYVDGTHTYGADEGLDGYSLNLGATAPVLGGTAYFQVAYLDAETSSDIVVDNTDKIGADITNYGVAAAYSYPLSKRTKVYTFAGYNESKYEVKSDFDGDIKVKSAEFGLGMVHTF